MKNKERELLRDFFVKTEYNVKRIERFSRQYPSPVINEYRYALGHLIGGESGKIEEDDYEKARAHIRKAYYDSCDILLDWLICFGKQYFEKISRIRSLSEISGIDEVGYLQALKKAQEIRFAPDEPRSARKETRYAAISNSIDKLSEYQNQIRDSRFSLREEFERHRRDFWRERAMMYIGVVLGLISAILTILSLWR